MMHQNCTKCAVVPGFGNFLICCVTDGAHFPVERRAVGYGLGAIGVLGLLAALTNLAFLKDLAGFANRVAYYLPYLVVATVAVSGAIWHLKAAQRDLSEGVGMMVGMTFGMIAGFLAGYLVGATNGMFVGSVFGIVVGMTTGWYVGDCCKMMGRMEGLMAGLMSGLMGAMTAVMLLNDRIKWFSPFLLLACLVILAGLSYLIHKEHREKRGVEIAVGGVGFAKFLIFTFLASAGTILVMLLAPRSFLFIGL